MKRSTKTEIVIPTWAGRSCPAYWGDQDYASHDDQAASFWVLLRGLVVSDPYSYMNDECRAVRDIGLYVWISSEDTVCIDLRLHDLSSLTLNEAVQRLKMLKRLFARGKGYPFDRFVRQTDVHTELTKALNALGIARALVYHGTNVPETFEPVGVAIKVISDHINERLERMKLRQAA